MHSGMHRDVLKKFEDVHTWLMIWACNVWNFQTSLVSVKIAKNSDDFIKPDQTSKYFFDAWKKHQTGQKLI